MGLLRLGDGVALRLEGFRVQGEVVIADDDLLGLGALGGRFLEERGGLGGEPGVGVFTLGLRFGLLGGGRWLAFFGELQFPGGDGLGQGGRGDVEGLLGLGDYGREFGEAHRLLGRREQQAFLAPTDVGFVDIREERAEGEEVALGEGVELMVMALRAARGLTQPGGADRADAVVQHALLVILGLSATFFRGQEQAIEAGADLGLLVGVGQQVAGDLFQGEAVEGFVLVETADDVVAVGPDIARGVAMVADRVGEADDIEPADRHAFAVMRRG